MSVKTTAMLLIGLLLLCVHMQVTALKSEEVSPEDVVSTSEESPFVLINKEMAQKEVKGAVSADYQSPAFTSLKIYSGSFPRFPGLEENTWIALHSPVKMYIPIRHTGASLAEGSDCVQCPKNMIFLLRGRQRHVMMPVPTISVCLGFARRSGRVHVAVVSGPRPSQYLTIGRYPIELMVWKADGPIHSCNYTIIVKGRKQSSKGPLVIKRPPCRKPEQPPNGLVLCVPQNKEYYDHNSVCQFFCMDYFAIENNTTSNSSTIVCKNGRWLPYNRAKCVATQCPAPPDVGAHGTWNCDNEVSDGMGFRGETECKVHCASGYTIRTSQLDRATLRCHPPLWNVTEATPRCVRMHLPKLLHCHDRHVIIGTGQKYRMQPKFLPKATTHDGAHLKIACRLQGRNLKKGLHRNRCQVTDPELRTQRKCTYNIRVEESSKPKPHPEDCRNRTVIVDLKSGKTTLEPVRFLVTMGDHNKTKVLYGNCTPSGELHPGEHLVLCESTDPVTNLAGTCSFWLTAKERTCKTLSPVRNGQLMCSSDETDDGHFTVGTKCEVICDVGYRADGNESCAVCQSDSRWSVDPVDDCQRIDPPTLLEGCEDTEFHVEDPTNVTVPKPLFLTSLNETLVAQCTPSFITADGLHPVECTMNKEDANVTCSFNVTVVTLPLEISSESIEHEFPFTEPFTVGFTPTEYATENSLFTEKSKANILSTEYATENSLFTEQSKANILSTESSTENSLFTEQSTANILSTESSTENSLFTKQSTANILPTESSTENSLFTEQSTANILPTESSTENSLFTEESTANILPIESSTENSLFTEQSTANILPTESSTKNSLFTEQSTANILPTESTPSMSTSPMELSTLDLSSTEFLSSTSTTSTESPTVESTSTIDILPTEIGFCKPLQEIPHGSISCPVTVHIGDKCELTCDPGYGFPGHSTHQAECGPDGEWNIPTLDDDSVQLECLAQLEGSAVEVWISFEAISPHCDEDVEEEIGDLVQELCQPYTECKAVSINCTLDEESDMMFVVVNWTVQADFDPEEFSNDDEEIPEAETRLETVLERSRHMITSEDAPPLQLFRDSFRRGLINLVCPERFMPDMLMARCVQCSMESDGDCL